MITTNLVNPRALSETVRNDTYTELWMRYVCLSPKIRTQLSAGSPQAVTLYKNFDRTAILSLLALAAALANALPALQHPSTLAILTEAASLGLLIWFEARGKQILIGLTKELVIVLYPHEAPQGTFFQFGEDLARRYHVTSFVDFNGRLDGLTKRLFISLFILAFLIYLYTPWIVYAGLFCLSFSWAFFFRPAGILRAALQLA